MTEKEWLVCSDPDELIDYHKMKKDPRRFRLLACSCVRQVVPDDAPPEILQMIEVIERYADGAATRVEFLAARKTIRNAIKAKVKAARALSNLADDAMEGVDVTIANVRTRVGKKTQCQLFRCVFGNPYRSVQFAPEWFTSTVVAIARGISAEHAFDRLTILADALEDAGCEDEAVLTHCRDKSPHSRGCWVLDGLLQQ